MGWICKELEKVSEDDHGAECNSQVTNNIKKLIVSAEHNHAFLCLQQNVNTQRINIYHVDINPGNEHQHIRSVEFSELIFIIMLKNIHHYNLCS